MPTEQTGVRVVRWNNTQHPSQSTIIRLMQKEGLTPYMTENKPNHRYAVRSHGYDKVMYLVEGALEVLLPDSNQVIRLRAGDRVEVPAGVRHAMQVGLHGAKYVEASVKSTK